MTQTKTRSDYGNVPRTEMKIKHIESMTEATLELTTSTSNLDLVDLQTIAYDEIRGPIKTRRELITIHQEPASEHEEPAESPTKTITIKGYTCSQWHHTPDELKNTLTQTVHQRLKNTQIDEYTLSARLGEEHDVHDIRGTELLNTLA